MKSIQVFSAIFFSFILNSCSPTIDHHGFGEHDLKIETIKIGKDKTQDVEKKLGSPSTISSFKEQVWYYVSKVTSRKSFFDPKLISQDVIAIYFDKNNTVKSIEKKSAESAKRITPNSNQTPTPQHDESLLREVFSSFGKRLSNASKSASK